MNLFWKISIQFLAVAVLIIVSALDYVKIHKGTKKYKRIRLGLFALIFLSLIVNVYIVINDERLKQQESEALNKQIITLQQEAESLNKQIAALQQKSDITTNSVTGGDSYCYMMVFHIDKDNMTASIRSDNKFPLYDIHFSVVDESVLKPFSGFGVLSMWVRTATTIPRITIGNLSPNEFRLISNIKIPDSEDIKLLITFSARNGSFYQRLRLKKVNGEWKQAIIVKRGDYLNENSDNPSIELLRKADTDFPLDENGKIW